MNRPPAPDLATFLAREMARDPERWIANLAVDFRIHPRPEGDVVATLTRPRGPRCWVACPRTMLVDYGRDELVKLRPAWVRTLAEGLLWVAGQLAGGLGMDHAQVLGNLCLSTNMYGPEWETRDLAPLTAAAREAEPGRVLVIRSVNRVQNPGLLERAREQGWLPVVCRQVFLYRDPEHWRKRKGTRNDRRLVRRGGYHFRPLDPGDPATIRRARELYDLLYLEKYSRQNVQFTEHYLSEVARAGFLDLHGLYRDGDDLPCGVVGLVELGQSVTAPVVGYDTASPREEGLYRRLMYFTVSRAFERGRLLNLSAGAGHFKRLRGGEATEEYLLVQVDHLPAASRLGWRVLSWLSRVFYGPLLRRLEL